MRPSVLPLSLVSWLALGAGCESAEEVRAEVTRKIAEEKAKRQEVLSRLSPPVEARLAVVQALGTRLARVPYAEAPAGPPRPKVPIRLERSAGADAANADLLMLAELDPLVRGLLGPCQQHLRSPGELSPLGLENVLKGCARLRYLLVVRTQERAAPTLTPDEQSFTGGAMRGDVVVVDLEERKVIGGFPISATIQGLVELDINGSPEGKQYRLDEALRKAAFGAVEAALRSASVDAWERAPPPVKPTARRRDRRLP